MMKKISRLVAGGALVVSAIFFSTSRCAAPAPQTSSAAPPAPAVPPASPPSAPAPAPAPSGLVADEQKGRALMDRAVAAMGGAAAIDGVRSLELEGKTKRIFPAGQETEFQSVATMLMSGAVRQELTLAFGKLTTVWTPRGAFTDMGDGPVLLPEAQSKELAKAFRRNLIGLLQGRKAPGFRAAALGPTPPLAGTTPAERVRISNGSEEFVLEIDAASGQVRAVRYNPEIVGGQEPKESVTEYSNYRPAGMLQYPYTTRTLVGGQVAQTSELTKVTVNGPVDESVFEPKTPPVPAEGANEPVQPAGTPAPAPTPTPGPKS